MSEVSNLSLSDVFFQALNAPKLLSVGVPPRIPLSELTTLPQTLYIPFPIPNPRRLRCLDLGA